MLKAEFYQGESRQLMLKVSLNGRPRDMSTDTLLLIVKRFLDDEESLIAKSDADFMKVYAAQGLVAVRLTSSDLSMEPGFYPGQLKITDVDGNIRKGAIELKILPALDDAHILETRLRAVSHTSEPQLTT